MKLYPKKLRGIEDLERERKLLQKEIKLREKEDIFSIEGILGKKSSKQDDGDGGAGGILDLLSLLPVGGPVFKMGMKLAQGLFAGRSKKKQQNNDEPAGGTKKKHPVMAFVMEVIGGYLKWKAVELSIRGVRHIIKTRKEKKQAE